MEQKVRKMNEPNEGVKCVVDTCHYYGSGNYCMAEKIQVEPRSAESSEETGCSTFRLKS